MLQCYLYMCCILQGIKAYAWHLSKQKKKKKKKEEVYQKRVKENIAPRLGSAGEEEEPPILQVPLILTLAQLVTKLK